LIELLVVIAIIAILAAILFPVFARARAKARAASCLSNMKQCAMASMMYADDFDDYPPGWTWSASGGTSGAPTHNPWYMKIGPYLPSKDVMHCTEQTNAGGNYMVGYAPDEQRAGGALKISFGAAKRPALTAFLFETWSYPPDLCANDPALYSREWLPTQKQSPMCNRGTAIHPLLYNDTGGQPVPSQCPHNGGCNTSFVDGHVKWHHATIIAKKYNPIWWQWQFDIDPSLLQW